MDRAIRARTAETPTQPSSDLRRRFSHGQFGSAIQALNDATGKALLSLKPIKHKIVCPLTRNLRSKKQKVNENPKIQ
jgi:hypothetical protein